MQNQSKKKKPKDKEVTLMTVLAYDDASIAGARKLLKKYNQPDAKSYEDLEYKLATLYTQTPDKIQIEKELAQINQRLETVTV